MSKEIGRRTEAERAETEKEETDHGVHTVRQNETGRQAAVQRHSVQKADRGGARHRNSGEREPISSEKRHCCIEDLTHGTLRASCLSLQYAARGECTNGMQWVV